MAHKSFNQFFSLSLWQKDFFFVLLRISLVSWSLGGRHTKHVVSRELVEGGFPSVRYMYHHLFHTESCVICSHFHWWHVLERESAIIFGVTRKKVWVYEASTWVRVRVRFSKANENELNEKCKNQLLSGWEFDFTRVLYFAWEIKKWKRSNKWHMVYQENEMSIFPSFLLSKWCVCPIFWNVLNVPLNIFLCAF